MQKRAIGLENEMSVFVIDNGQNGDKFSIVNAEPLTNNLMLELWEIMESQNFKLGHNVCGGENNFLFNGGRIYKDSAVLESATPECSGPDELADYELANESILLDVMQKADERFIKEDASSGFYFEISKKCGDFSDINGGFGCHENYHLEKPLGWKISNSFFNFDDFLNDFLSDLSRYLAPYLISRAPFIGSGHLDNSGKFIASHRLSVTNSLFNPISASNLNKKTMLMIRKERDNSADMLKGKFRLQICASDSNMSSFCAQFKFGPTSLILRMIEEEFWTKPPIALKNTLETAKNAAGGDTNLKVLLANGQTVSLLEINKLYFTEAIKFFKTRVKSDDENKIMEMWKSTLRIQEKMPSILDKTVDWRILYNSLSAVLEKKYSWSWETLQTNLQSGDLTIKQKAKRALKILQMFNLQYFFLRKNEVREAIKNSGLMDNRLKALENYFNSPLKFNPPDTRAKWRFDAMNHVLKNKSLYRLLIDWGIIIVEPLRLLESSQSFTLENFDPLNSKFYPTDFLRKKAAN